MNMHVVSKQMAIMVVGAIVAGTSQGQVAPPSGQSSTTPVQLTPKAAVREWIRTPKPALTPRINGPRVYGVRPGHRFVYRIPATGERPMTFAAEDLPDGLILDKQTGIMAGQIDQKDTYKVTVTASNARGSDKVVLSIMVGDEICLTPPMGWNSSKCLVADVNEVNIRVMADAMIASGLADHGWSFVRIDDGWSRQSEVGDPILGGPARDEAGAILPNKKFNDMQGLGDYIHGKGLKFGLYASPGPKTWGGFEGSYGHELQDAQTFARWGVDFVKYDWCSYEGIARERLEEFYARALRSDADELKSLGAEFAKLYLNQWVKHPWPKEEADRLQEVRWRLDEIHKKLDPEKATQFQESVRQEPYRFFHRMLMAVNRDMVYSAAQPWAKGTGVNCCRSTENVAPRWEYISEAGFSLNGTEGDVKPGVWNDPGMLEVGTGQLTVNEMYAQVSLWSLLSAPLSIGCNLTRLDEFTLGLLGNDEVLAVDQDSLGKQGSRLKKDGTAEVWVKPLADGTLAVGFFNRGLQPAAVSVKWSELNLQEHRWVRDLWRQRDLGDQATGMTVMVAAHGAELYRVGLQPASESSREPAGNGRR